jgi:hypothetical protein
MASILSQTEKRRKQNCQAQETAEEIFLEEYEAANGAIVLQPARIDWEESVLLHSTPPCAVEQETKQAATEILGYDVNEHIPVLLRDEPPEVLFR